MKQSIIRYGVLVVFLMIGACGKSQEAYQEPSFTLEKGKTETTYIFSVHPLHNPKRLHAIFNPLMEYLSKEIDGVKFVFEASRNYAAYDERLYGGIPHFSLPNPYQTINSLKHGYHVFGKMGDDQNFRGIILVRKDSGIEKVADLKGKTISYPAPTALAATMMPQYFLHSRGLDVMNDVTSSYVGSQESSIMNVFYKDVAAGATWPQPWKALVKERPELERELVVKWQTDTLPNNGLVVRDDVSESIVAQVASLLFNLQNNKQGQEWLEKMELSRFEPATNETYSSVVSFVKKFNAEVRPVK